MLPSSLLALTASFIVPIIAAAPSCVAPSDATGYAAQKLPYLYNDFCSELSSSNFGTKQKLYDSPVMALSFTVAAAGECSLASCLSGFKSLVEGCQKSDGKSIWGTGSLTTGCGTFSFNVWSPAATASLGTPDATITVATMKTYDIASLTASTSTSSSSSPTSYPASTTSEAQLPTSYLASTGLFANSTSSTAAGNSSTSYISATLVSTASIVSSTQAATPTKPDVGSTALGTSGAGMLRVSGLSLVVVATVFGFFL